MLSLVLILQRAWRAAGAEGAGVAPASKSIETVVIVECRWRESLVAPIKTSEDQKARSVDMLQVGNEVRQLGRGAVEAFWGSCLPLTVDQPCEGANGPQWSVARTRKQHHPPVLISG
jgi:hypothetical protein